MKFQKLSPYMITLWLGDFLEMSQISNMSEETFSIEWQKAPSEPEMNALDLSSPSSTISFGIVVS